MNSHANKTFPCERCGKPFTRNSNMKKHAQFCEAPISDQTPVSNEDQGDRVNRRGSEKECNADPGSSRRELSWAFISALITNPNQCCIERLRKNAMAIANSADCRRNVDYIGNCTANVVLYPGARAKMLSRLKPFDTVSRSGK